MDTSGISFTALYTGQVWYQNGMSARFFTSNRGNLMYRALQPANFLGKRLIGLDLQEILLQRHRIIDHRIEHLIREEGVAQILEIACGLSPRGYKFSRKHPALHYVEADLPGMASRKQALLLQHKGFGPNHKVVNCNILTSGEPDGLDYVLKEVLDPALPTVIITEGLVNYFDLPTISGFWQRLAELGQVFPKAWYLTDLFPDVPAGPSRPLIKAAQKALGIATGAKVNLHFSNTASIEQGFSRCGFQQVTVHKPEQFADLLQLPLGASYVRVVEARVPHSSR